VKNDDNALYPSTLLDSGHGGVTGLNAGADGEARVKAFPLDALGVKH
jgi:hypothetical protein